MFQFTKDDIMNMIQLGVMFVLGLVVVFMVIRPLVKRVLASDPAQEGGLPALADGGLPQIGTDGHAAGAPTMIDIAQVQGQVHAQSVHRVGELADRNPNETAAIVRQWLAEPA
jgi:flagellar M-ring protein FliF